MQKPLFKYLTRQTKSNSYLQEKDRQKRHSNILPKNFMLTIDMHAWQTNKKDCKRLDKAMNKTFKIDKPLFSLQLNLAISTDTKG